MGNPRRNAGPTESFSERLAVYASSEIKHASDGSTSAGLANQRAHVQKPPRVASLTAVHHMRLVAYEDAQPATRAAFVSRFGPLAPTSTGLAWRTAGGSRGPPDSVADIRAGKLIGAVLDGACSKKKLKALIKEHGKEEALALVDPSTNLNLLQMSVVMGNISAGRRRLCSVSM